jgi:hypothetical protein
MSFRAIALYPRGNVRIGRVLREMHACNWTSFGYEGRDVQRFLPDHRLKCLDLYLMKHRTFPGRQYLRPCFLSPCD